MPSSYSTNLKIELQATGENSGTWGTITNTNLGTALEQAIVGYGNPNYASDANLTLTYTDTNAAQAARALVLNVTSGVSLTGTRELVVPTIQKQYIVQNNTTGSQSITVKTSAGTGITVPNGRKAHLYVNGTDVIYMDDYVDINGGAIDGTPIGANSASTGAFSTLSASGNVTLSGGTANGVLYLDASKVATSGTALIFDGSKLGIGGTPPTTLYVKGTAGGTDPTVVTGERVRIQSNDTTGRSTYLSTIAGTAANSGILFGDQDAADVGRILYAHGTNSLQFFTNSAEVARFDSSGRLGLNTTPGTGSGLFSLAYTSASLYSTAGAYPGAADAAFCGTYAINTSATTGAFAGNVLYVRNGSSVYQSAGISAVSVAGAGYSPNLNFWAQDGASTFATRMTIDSSGNLGLGVTPSAWTSAFGPVIQVKAATGGGALTGSSADNFRMFANTFYDGAYKRIGAGYATQYEQAAGQHSWYTAGTSTANSSITFTQAMTLDASGNLGVGTTSPISKLSVVGSGTAVTTSGGDQASNATIEGPNVAIGASFTSQLAVLSNSSVAANAGGGIAFGAKYSGNAFAYFGAIKAGKNDGTSGTFAGYLSFATRSTGNLTEHMRLDSSGNVGIGTASPATKLTVSSATNAGLLVTDGTVNTIVYNSTGGVASIGTTSNHPVDFYSNNAARMRIDTSGKITDQYGNIRAIPRTGSAKTTSYTLATTDVGQFVEVGSGGSVTVPNSTFATGDVVSIFNNTSGNVTLTMSITTAYIGGTDADKNTITLATRGVATILFISGTVCVVNGNVS